LSSDSDIGLCRGTMADGHIDHENNGGSGEYFMDAEDDPYYVKTTEELNAGQQLFGNHPDGLTTMVIELFRLYPICPFVYFIRMYLSIGTSEVYSVLSVHCNALYGLVNIYQSDSH